MHVIFIIFWTHIICSAVKIGNDTVPKYEKITKIVYDIVNSYRWSYSRYRRSEGSFSEMWKASVKCDNNWNRKKWIVGINELT